MTNDNVRKMVKTDEMRAIYEVPAPYCGRVYITTVNGLFRVSFCEEIPELGENITRSAVTMTWPDFASFASLLQSTAENFQKTMEKQTQVPELDIAAVNGSVKEQVH